MMLSHFLTLCQCETDDPMLLLSILHTIILVFFAALLRALGFGCVCVSMSRSGILLP